ncbi:MULTISPECIES: CHASE domain-containing protein [unclassified Pseudomonas]|uniref:PAS domain-containing hybrid sensor histidine kinase/response regulator n=1 Tax=unclassified Pseudomonas TaxID=196821 RepID=UPI000BD10519|nr:MULTISPECIES: CHASE domain-containing protein [unclassified Pseudomonas]PVZ20502.1 PAS domain S-box-containing protein [Pseudomonas sp. URIL14HWK12:I12]PVZ27568.1 PAS domain S-box-containing protein [Pseudomonas sp. URIL14HWK12:I10]PVZ38457.1 PAS domain S-box-containing protein [Pseudomonas sp. URIL14HWK12:I11]SNZ03279.1 PAS domain S-box-containing protein [Pseudomonas sp. URIL14HWK12:I9]
MIRTASAFLPTAAVTFALGLSVAVACSLWVVRSNDDRAHAASAEAARHTVDAVYRRIQLYQYGLRGARGAVTVMGDEHLNRAMFHRYAMTRDLATEFPGARGYGFVRRVSPAQQQAFIAQARADGAPTFDVRQLTPQSGDRLVVQYLEPEQGNEAAIGLDIASEVTRRTAALDAIRSGEPRLTGPITLVQATGQTAQSFLILMPVYRTIVTPARVAEREAQAIGLTFAPLLMRDVLAELKLDTATQQVDLIDITQPDQPKPFYSSPPLADSELYPQHLPLELLGRRWQLDFSVGRAFVDALRLPSPGWVLLAGACASLLLACLAGAVAIGVRQRRQIADARMELGAIVESASDAIIGTSLEGRITSWNRGAELLFGFPAEQAIGRTVAELIVPVDRQDEERQMLERIAAGETVGHFDTQRLNAQGEPIDVSLSPSPVFDTRGKVAAASVTVRDISLQKAQAARILELNARLRAQVSDSMATNRAILEAMIDPVLTVDAHGTVLSFNPAGTRVFGYTPDTLVGQNVKKLIPRGYWRLVDRLISRGSRRRQPGGQQRRLEISGQRQDGSIFPARVSVGVKAGTGERVFVCVVSDITQQRRQRSELMAARDHLLLAAEAAQLGIWSWDPSSGEIQWNPRMFELYGLPNNLESGEKIFQQWLWRLHPADRPGVEAGLQALVEHDTPFDPVFRVMLPDGQLRYVQAGGRVERGLNGQALRVTGINLDVTASRELETRLRQAKAQADEGSAAKSAFLANMSHEIRTPMNAVLGMLQLVQRTNLDSQQLDYLSKARQAATSLLDLLNDVLDYSKIEAGKLVLDPHPFELEALLQELAVIMAGNQGNKDVEAVFDIDPRIPSRLVGDALRLKQILVNLAGNALKFTAEGEVVVRLSLLHRLGRGVGVRVAVQDTGIGITAEQRERIFEGFSQAEASTTRRFGGTGLGLVISNRLVALMGGTLCLESVPGQGSRFWFDVVLEADRATLGEHAPEMTRPGLRLLVADDNATSADVLVRMVKAQGWYAEAVDSGQRAVTRACQAHAEAEAFDLLLMDWRMPDLDGLGAARQIRHRLGDNAPRMIMVTAYSDELHSTAAEALRDTFTAMMTKPVTPLQLRDTVYDAMGGAPVTVVPAPVERQRRLAGLYVLVVEDNALNRQVASGLLHAEGARVHLAENGKEGIDAVRTSAEPFDVVLMDVQMPEVDGLEATRVIRSDHRFLRLPIIAMTANAGAEDRAACLQAGMNDHLGKPIDLGRLVDVIRHWTGRDELPAGAKASEQAPADSLLDPWGVILARFDDDQALLREVLAVFVSDCGQLIQRLRELMAEPDPQAARALFHAIKGSAATMGARALSERAGALEQGMSRDDPDALVELMAGTGIQALAELLQASEAALRERLGAPPAAPPPAPAMPNWADGLAMLEASLRSGNLQALEMVQRLGYAAPPVASPWWPRLVGQVNALDFNAALATVKTLQELPL